MKKTNYYFTLILVFFTTVFSFFNMFQIVSLSKNIISIVYNNLLPSLLPFMILISLCLYSKIIYLLNYFIQWIFCPLFHLTPIMSSLYFLSFFCGYPTNAKIIKESYDYHYISLNQLQHLLSIASFSSPSFLFISLKLDTYHAIILYIAHILPSLIKALFYHEDYQYQTFHETLSYFKTPQTSFIKAIKQSIISSLYAFIFILGYMLVFQFICYSLSFFIPNSFLLTLIQGFLEFSSGSIQLLQYQHFLVYPCLGFFLSFSGLSVLMQIDNLLEETPYRFKTLFKDRIIHGICSFFILFFFQLLTFRS